MSSNLIKSDVSGDLSAFFQPRSIAVVGASPGKSGYANLVLKNLTNANFAGTISVVHPKYDEVDGVTAYPGITELPETPDLCVIAVNAGLTPGILAECVERKVPAVTIIAAGFAELGTEEGIALQQQLADTVKGSSTRLLGPNCLGMASFINSAVSMASANIPDHVPTGSTAIVSQSGGVSLAIMLRGVSQGLGLSHVISVGNELNIGVSELLNTLSNDPQVTNIICYMEGVRDAAALREGVSACAAQNKPVIMLRGGLTQAGRAAAASHTGALAGDGGIWRDFVTQIGAIEATTIDHAIAIARLFSRFGITPGSRVGGFAGGGGLTVLFTDLLGDAQVELPQFEQDTQERIRTALPDVTPHNPMDMGGLFLSGDGTPLRDALTALAEDPNVDVLAFCVPPYLEFRDRIANGAIVNAMKNITKPSIVISYGIPGAKSVLKDNDQFMLEPPEPGIKGLKSWLGHQPKAALVEAESTADNSRAKALQTQLAAQVSSGQMAVLEDLGKAILGKYQVPCPAEQIVGSTAEALAFTDQVGTAIALKIVSKNMMHRGVGKGVLLDLSSSEQVSQAYASLEEQTQLDSDAHILAQEMVGSGFEVLVGAVRDPEIGLCLALGKGGSNVEAERDVRFFALPVTRDTIAEHFTSWQTLQKEQDRLGQALDIDALVDAAFNIATLLTDGQDFVDELDINPIIVGTKGKGAVAVDALIVLRNPDGSQ